jgi:predicted neuraminidase
VHAASAVELKDGRLRAVWFSGSREGASDVTIQTAVMDPSTLQWGPEHTLFDRQQLEQSLWRYVKKLGNPVLARAPDGSLVLWIVNVSLGGWAGSAISWSRSIDEGGSWSPPKRLVTSPFLNISTLVKSGPVALAGGEMLLPVYHELLTKFAEVLRINPAGQVVDKIRIPASRTRLQPVILVQDATHAQMLMRSAGEPRIAEAATSNAGKTWSAAVSGPLPNPDSAVAGVVAADGGRWLALNPLEAGRQSLALFRAAKDGDFDPAAPFLIESPATSKGLLSRREYAFLLGTELAARGASGIETAADIASAMRQLCNETACSPEYSYPFLLQGRDGYLHVFYTWQRARIKHVRLDPVRLTGRP